MGSVQKPERMGAGTMVDDLGRQPEKDGHLFEVGISENVVVPSG